MSPPENVTRVGRAGVREFHTGDELKAAAGTVLGASDWLEIDQDRIGRFADATNDHQWIHVDPQRARESQYGATIAHGFLVLSLVPYLMWQTFSIDPLSTAINYGLDKVRFITPVPVGSRIRDVVRLDRVTEAGGGLQLAMTHTIEIEGETRPACVAKTLIRAYL